ncbi:MAG: HD domain-containing protein [Pirellulales bacterium]
MPSGARLRSSVLSAREHLAEGREQLRQQHDRGLDGVKVCGRFTSLMDSAVQRLYDAALDDLPARDAAELRERVTLVAHGGYGRRQQSPHSDVDMMVLYGGKVEGIVADFARRLTQDIFDVGIQLGQSVRTAAQAIQMARSEPQIGTSLIESRLLLGSTSEYESYLAQFKAMVEKNRARLGREFIAERRVERLQYGETVYLLEPNLKRSRGGMRDIHLLRWLWFLRCGVADFDRLHDMGVLSKFDHRRLISSQVFLLRVRNEMHFHANEAADMLTRAEQVRLAQYFQYRGRQGLLPVEQFMRDYFHHTNHIWHLAHRLSELVQPPSRVQRVFGPVLGYTTSDGYHIGRREISATAKAMARLELHLDEVLRLVQLARTEEKRISQDTWYFVYRTAPQYSNMLEHSTAQKFLKLLDEPERLGELLRRLLELGVLEKIIPEFAHARCLLQFNQYHKYTVDEHSIRTVEEATHFADRRDALGEAYVHLQDKRMLHLALLIHDLGKGYDEDHSDVGRRIAQRIAERFELSVEDSDTLEFLVHKHLLMSHLAFRRDTSQMALLKRFAEEVGTPERLQLLALVSCADLAGVGPGVLNNWKVDVLFELYRRTLRMLTPERAIVEDRDESARKAALAMCTPDEQQDGWFARQLEALPESFIARRSPAEVIEVLRRFRTLEPRGGTAWAGYWKETDTVEFFGAIDQGAGRAIFSSMAGALTSHGMQILSAETHTLADGWLLLHYVAHDPDYPGEPPAQRLDAVCESLAASIDREEPPTFRKVWGQDQHIANAALSNLPNEVRIDTQLSDECSIVEIFTIDRRGLLYGLARALHDLGLIIRFAKIGTYLDQVVDVFYVTERDGTKPIATDRLEEIRTRLFEVVGPTASVTAPH